MRVAVVIPIYKALNAQTEGELKSLRQTGSVLRNRQIILLHPPSVNIEEYLKFFLPLKVDAFVIKEKYFGNVHRYNLLLTSYGFYKLFSAFDFILICQTDAFVFSDELDYWCAMGMDYIGAPWFEGKDNPTLPFKFRGVGNGGFSLRRVNSFLNVSKNWRFVFLHRLLTQLYRRLQGENHKALKKALGLKFIMNTIFPFTGYEDEFWGLIVPRRFKRFRVAAPEAAMKFSFEVMPSELYRLNGCQLPFGCHAWEKYDKLFWTRFIR